MTRPTPAGASAPPHPPEDDDPRYADIEEMAGPDRAAEALERRADLIRQLWIEADRNYLSAQLQMPTQYRTSAKWDGGVDKKGHTHKPVWPEIAAFVCKNQLDPRILVEAQFDKRSGPPPLPNCMKTQGGLDRYRIHLAGLITRRKRAYEGDKIAARMAVFKAKYLYKDTRRTYRSVLYDLDNQISALYRYCLARRMGMDDVALEWRQLALEQYLCEPLSYDEVWGADVPPDLKDEARALARAFADLGKGAGGAEEEPTG